MFKFCFSGRKEQIFQLNKAHFADVASSYIEKMQRSVAEKDVFVGRTIIFKHALNSNNHATITTQTIRQRFIETES